MADPLQRRDTSRAHLLLYLFIATISILYSALYVYRMASTLSDENLYRDSAKGVEIISIKPGGASDKAGLKVGDVITAIDGRAVKSAREANDDLIRASHDKPLYYSILRDGKIQVFPVYLASFGLPMVVVFVLLSAVGLFALGLMVMVRRHTHPIARLFAWVMLGWAVFFSVIPSIASGLRADWVVLIRPQILFVSWILMMGGTIHLLFHFPSERFSQRLPGRFIIFVYGNAAFWILLSIIPLPLPMPVSLMLAPVLSVTIVEFVIKKKYRSQEIKRPREQMKMLIWAAACGVWFLLFLTLAAVAGFSQVFLAPVMGIPLVLFLIISRFRVFDLYVLGRRTLFMLSVVLLHGVTLSVFALGVSSLSSGRWNPPLVRFSATTVEIVLLSQLPDEDRSTAERGVMAISGALLGLLLFWGNGRMRQMVSRKFHRQDVDYRRAMREFGRLSMRFSDRKALAEAVGDSLLPLMQVRGVWILFEEGGQFPLAAAIGATPHLPCIDWEATLGSAPGSMAAADPLVKDAFAGSGVEFLTPIRLQGVLRGVLLLGGKEAETNFTRKDVELLNSLALHVASALETMELYVGVREQERMRKELELASRIQLNSLPAEIPDLPTLDIAVASLPALEVGGDFYDFIVEHPEVTFFIGDVSGKGLSAALHLSHIQGILHALQPYASSMWELFVRINTQVLDRMERTTFVTMSALRIDLLNKRAALLRAGHTPLLHYRAETREVLERCPSGLGIGLHDRIFAESLVEDSFTPDRGDILMGFSDGLMEAFNTKDEQFGIERLSEILRDNSGATAAEILRKVLDALTTFAGDRERHDDTTLLIVRFL